jgi:hypothetical protein
MSKKFGEEVRNFEGGGILCWMDVKSEYVVRERNLICVEKIVWGIMKGIMMKW